MEEAAERDMTPEKIRINVSGHIFVTTATTLSRYSQTKLGKLAADVEQTGSMEYFFDADEEVFREVLRYHRTGELHVPRNMCYQTFCKQLEYWEISEEEIEECCQCADKCDSQLEKEFLWFERRIELDRELRWKDHVWYFLTDPIGPYTKYRKAATVWTLFYCLMVVIQSINNAALTLPGVSRKILNSKNASYQQHLQQMFSEQACNLTNQQMETIPLVIYYVETAYFVLFATEIFIRFFCCPQKRAFFSSVHMVDLSIALVQVVQYATYFGVQQQISNSTATTTACFVMNSMQNIMFFMVQMRCLRLLIFATVFSHLQVLLLAVYTSRKEIALLITVLGISCLICAPIMFYSELIGLAISDMDDYNLDSIPTAYWWVVVTMTTVGYGDYYPKSGIGYILAAVIIILGMMLTALPIAIIGTNFTVYHEYNKKRCRKGGRAAVKKTQQSRNSEGIHNEKL